MFFCTTTQRTLIDIDNRKARPAGKDGQQDWQRPHVLFVACLAFYVSSLLWETDSGGAFLAVGSRSRCHPFCDA